MQYLEAMEKVGLISRDLILRDLISAVKRSIDQHQSIQGGEKRIRENKSE